MSRIENSIVHSIASGAATTSNLNGQSNASRVEQSNSSTSFLSSSFSKYCLPTTSNEKRSNYALNSHRDFSNVSTKSDTQSESDSSKHSGTDPPPLQITNLSKPKLVSDIESFVHGQSSTFDGLTNTVDHTLNSLDIEDSVPNEETTHQHNADVEKVDEVESCRCEGGDEVFEIETTGTTSMRTPLAADAIQSCEADASDACTPDTPPTLQNLAPSTQEQILKPILKRKDLLENCDSVCLQPSLLPPPILKKRDSLGDVNVCTPPPLTAVCASLNVTNNSIKPPSILKHRQSGSYSFDETISSCEGNLSADDFAQHLKPILKKKSWSTEENVASFSLSSQFNENVKGILKSADKSTITSFSISLLSDDSQSLHTHAKTETKAALKSILKIAPKNRSASLSPGSSSESLSDELNIDTELSSSHKKPLRSAFCKKNSFDEGTLLRPTSLSPDVTCNPSENLTAVSDIASDIDHTAATLSVINIRPILKKCTITSSTSPTSSSTNSSNTDLANSDSVSDQADISSLIYSARISQSPSPLDTMSDSSVNSSKESATKLNDDLSMDTSPVVYLRKHLTPIKARPKSCFVTSGQSKYDEKCTPSPSSITERLAKLKQNGEEGWKNRVQKPKIEDEIATSPCDIKLRKTENDPKSSVIANRVSCLVESQSQWRNRVSECDAKQFTVASKQQTATGSQCSSGEKVLRDTPKRIGLRGSTLNESALLSLSSKLNKINCDKSIGSSPSAQITKNNPPTLSTDCQSSIDEPTNNATPIRKLSSSSIETNFILKPDDEESFKSFYGFDDSTFDSLIETKTEPSSIQLSLDSVQPNSLLLPNETKRRIKVPRRRPGTDRNPLKSLANNPISLESSITNLSSADNDSKESVSKSSAKIDLLAKSNPNLAISALAGLASSEDFKSVATKLRSSSTGVNLSGNDSWRIHDLKNSLQTKMLILVKGRRKAQIRLIEPKWTCLNSNDSFILVTKDTVYAFIAKFSNIIERTKCMEVAQLIRKRKDLCYKSPTNELVLIDGQSQSANFSLFDKMAIFLKELDFSDVHKAELEKRLNFMEPNSSVDEDEYYEESMICTNMIYKAVSQTESKPTNVELVPVEKYWGRSPRHDLLKQEDVFVFDYGTEMYVWIGKNVSNSHRTNSIEAAKELWLKGYDYSELEISPYGPQTLKSDKRPDWAWFVRVNHNLEPILFKDKFFNWPAFTLTRSVKKRSQTRKMENTHLSVKKDLSQNLNLIPVKVEENMIKKLSPEPNLVLENFCLGRGTGDIIKDEDGLEVKISSLEFQCFFIDDIGNKVALTDKDRYFLFSSESYYIRWKYRLTRISRDLKTGGESRYSEQHGGRDRLCYFVWQGKDARNTQRGATALNAIDKLREEGAFQVSIENGNEEPAFLRIFDASLVIQLGKRSQVLSNSNYRMFTLKSLVKEETFMVELECSIRNLRSRSSFILICHRSSKTIYIWHGCKADKNRQKLTKEFLNENLIDRQSKEFGFTEEVVNFEMVEVQEGKENKIFFDIFANSSSDSTLQRASRSNLHREIYFSLIDDSKLYEHTPRLFQFISSPDKGFEAIEIVPTYLPSHHSKLVIEYPFSQLDIYERAKNRPTFFLFDNHYEIYLWESKYSFYICNKNSMSSSDNELTSDMPRMIDIDNEIQSETNTTTGSLVYLWHAERKCALESTLSYCYAKNSSEPPEAYVISAGLEPDSFCALFPTWIYYDNVAQIHIKDGRKPGEQILVQEVLSQIRDINKSVYSYEKLTQKPLPEGINLLCLESYLDDTEFENIFRLNREEFYALTTWKQKQIKQDKSLF